MNRNRASGGMSRHAIPDEETQVWSQAADSLEDFLKLRNDESAFQRPINVNRLVASLPEEDDPKFYNGVSHVREELLGELHSMKTQADKELRALNTAIEKIDILIALRASDPGPQVDKRNKRTSGRATSPNAGSSGTPQPSLGGGSGRGSAAPSVGSNSASGGSSAVRTGKVGTGGRHEIGRAVAYRAPPKKNPETKQMEEAQWILAKVRSYEGQNKYKVEDADDESPATYSATASQICPLPAADSYGPTAQFPDFPASSRVLAVYPGTTVFYGSVVVEPPRKSGPPSRAANVKVERMYKVKFDDDEDTIQNVPAHLVFASPAGM
ncbi:hypothetical protein DL93DRAFT_2090695 [Clavulina sp. PMI_390]|nr:hypothetical protein DL93DRAFT_2090695 [Clavulina sp. PMI_390]